MNATWKGELTQRWPLVRFLQRQLDGPAEPAPRNRWHAQNRPDGLALLWQILSSTGFPNRFFCDSWVVGFWRGRPWLAGHRIGKTSLAIGSGRFWIGWATRRGDKCVRSTCRD